VPAVYLLFAADHHAAAPIAGNAGAAVNA
jgi:hypothetical protein